MSEIKSSYPVNAIDIAQKYIGEPHSISLAILALIDDSNKKLDINFYVYDEASIEFYRTCMLNTLLRCESDKVLFRSLSLNGKFLTSYRDISNEINLTDQINTPTSSNDFLLGSKVIMDLVVDDNQTTFKCYRVNEKQPRTLVISVKPQDIVVIYPNDL